jgi:hypothetical protein
VALLVRLFLKEPERWKQATQNAAPVRLAEIFGPGLRHITFAGVCMSLVALIAWWSCNAFNPTVATGLAQDAATADGLGDRDAGTRGRMEVPRHLLVQHGRPGRTLLTIPVAKILAGARCSASTSRPARWRFATFYRLEPTARLYWYFAIGLGIRHLQLHYYPPELFPPRRHRCGSATTSAACWLRWDRCGRQHRRPGHRYRAVTLFSRRGCRRSGCSCCRGW